MVILHHFLRFVASKLVRHLVQELETVPSVLITGPIASVQPSWGSARAVIAGGAYPLLGVVVLE